MKILLAISLLFISFSTQADFKKNRHKYANYVGSRYNNLLKTERVLGDILLYNRGHRDLVTYLPREYPFPKGEAVKGGQIHKKYYKRTLKLGDKLGAIRDVMNSVFKKWTAQNYNNLKALVGEVNSIWRGFGNDMIKTFPKGSKMRNEPPIKSFIRSFESWKIKSIRDLDNEK